ncbi:MAG: hypothetical protein COA79_00225 [Planctomycetota bacterium]|nr:MAG: hypothetical protein COA79_00225 [Planctomycetota bacterium]
MLKVGIIGVSGFGNVHYLDILHHVELGKMKVIAATIINQDEEAEKCEKLISLGCQLFTDYLTMLEEFGSDMDLCFIPTGIPFHAPMSIAAVENGVNVLVEKPVAPTMKDLENMKSAEKKSGKFIAVGFQDIYSKTIYSIKEKILNNIIGNVESIRSHCIRGRPRSYYDRNAWAGKVESNGNLVYDSPFNNAFAHHLNCILFLGGKELEKSVVPIDVSAELYRANDIESCDTASLLMNTEEGPNIGFFTTHACRTDSIQTSKIYGNKGTITWVHGDSYTIELFEGKTEVIKEYPFSRSMIIDALDKKINGEDSLICSLAIAGAHTTVVEKAFKYCEIKTIDKQFYNKIEENESSRVAIDDIESILKECFNDGCHISDVNNKWANKLKS